MANLFKGMIGGTYLYNGEQHTIQAIERFEDDLYNVITNKRSLRVSAGELRKDFKPVYVPKGKNGQALVLRVEEELKPVESLSKVLLRNIEKIEKHAGYIPQANAINNQAKTLISIAKLKLDIVKLKGKI